MTRQSRQTSPLTDPGERSHADSRRSAPRLARVECLGLPARFPDVQTLLVPVTIPALSPRRWIEHLPRRAGALQRRSTQVSRLHGRQVCRPGFLHLGRGDGVPGERRALTAQLCLTPASIGCCNCNAAG